VVFSTGDGDPLNELSFATQLRRAVERRHWVMHYQPLVRLSDASIVGLEALLRWQDPGGELVLPAMFMSLAEEMGLSELIGDWVLEELCRQLRVWKDLGLDMQMSLNLSPRQLRRPNLVRQVVTAIEGARIDPSRIVV